MPTVAGIDSSTQSCKVVVCDLETGKVLAERRAGHPNGTEVHPTAWWSALAEAGKGLIGEVEALAVAGQQHGMVTLDDKGEVVRPALLWNDMRSADAAATLVDELGAAEWAKATGSVPGASFTVSKLRWLAEHEPEAAARTADVLLPHDWLTWRLAGSPRSGATTDRGEASGTGYFSPAEGQYRFDLVERALGHEPWLPRIAGVRECCGHTESGVMIAPGTGDNMAAALGLGARIGDVVVSLGTSGTVFAVSERPTADPSGNVAGFADATGHFLPLVCTLNASRVLTSSAAMLGTDLAGLDELALRADSGAGGMVFLPYLDGERTPSLPEATGALHGLTRTAMTPENLARAAVEGMLCGLADGLDALAEQGVEARRVLLIGGAARSQAVRAVAPELFGLPVVVPDSAEYVAIGAARQAAWMFTDAAEPPAWSVAATTLAPPTSADLVAGQATRLAFAELRRRLHGV